jgi:hypothetical protein
MTKKPHKRNSIKIAKQIYDLAKKIVNAPEGADKITMGEDISSTIYACLESGDDHAIFEAMALANDAGDVETFQEIVSTAEDESSWADLTTDDDSPYVVSHLFAIPVVIELPFSGFSPTLEDGDALRKLEQSIKSARIADGDPDVRIVNYLYTPTELSNSTPGDIFRTTLQTPNTKPGGFANKSWNFLQWNAETNTVESIQQSIIPRAARLDSNVVLRYLVGTFSTKDFVDPFETAYDSEEDGDEHAVFIENMAEWQINAIELVSTCVGHDSSERKLTIGALDTFYMATKLGDEDYKQTIMALQMHEALNAKSLTPKSTRALVAPFGKHFVTEIRIALISLLTSEFVTGLVYALNEGEDYDSVMERIAHQLLQNDVFSIDIISELQRPDDPKFTNSGFLVNHSEVRNSFEMIDHSGPRVLH